MFYLNLKALSGRRKRPGPRGARVLAPHRVLPGRHARPFSRRAARILWLAEGFTTYAEYLAGYDQRVNSWLRSSPGDPNSVTCWQGLRANYGASYSFMPYLADRQGAGFIRTLLGQPRRCRGHRCRACRRRLFQPDVLVALRRLGPRRPARSDTIPGLAPLPLQNRHLSVFSVEPVTLSGPEPVLGTAQVVDSTGRFTWTSRPRLPPPGAFEVVVDGAAGAPLHAALVFLGLHRHAPP